MGMSVGMVKVISWSDRHATWLSLPARHALSVLKHIKLCAPGVSPNPDHSIVTSCQGVVGDGSIVAASVTTGTSARDMLAVSSVDLFMTRC